MELRNRLRRTLAATSFVAGMLVLFSIPALSAADLGTDLLTSLGLNGNKPADQSGQSGTTASDPRGGIPGVGAGYNPPLHGSNPHGQGTVATVDIPPNNAEPLPGTPSNGPELIVVGRSKGEQNPDGSYHGVITIASVLGINLAGIETNEGQTQAGPLDAVNQGVLNAMCAALANQVCLNVLSANSSTTGNGSTNSFQAVSIGNVAGLLNGGVASSQGNISDDGTCQTASSSSNVANANVAGGAINANALNSSSSSQACNNGTAPSTTQSSGAIALNGVTVPVPPPPGCGAGTPDTTFSLLPPLNLITTSCNADDPGTSQASLPYGVREALAVFGDVLGTGLLKITTSASESKAQAPAAAAAPPGLGPPLIGPGGGGGPGDEGGPDDEGGPTAETAQGGGGELAFTGVDLIWIAMLGLGLVVAGLAIAGTASAVRRPRLDG